MGAFFSLFLLACCLQACDQDRAEFPISGNEPSSGLGQVVLSMSVEDMSLIDLGNIQLYADRIDGEAKYGSMCFAEENPVLPEDDTPWTCDIWELPSDIYIFSAEIYTPDGDLLCLETPTSDPVEVVGGQTTYLSLSNCRFYPDDPADGDIETNGEVVVDIPFEPLRPIIPNIHVEKLSDTDVRLTWAPDDSVDSWEFRLYGNENKTPDIDIDPVRTESMVNEPVIICTDLPINQFFISTVTPFAEGQDFSHKLGQVEFSTIPSDGDIDDDEEIISGDDDILPDGDMDDESDEIDTIEAIEQEASANACDGIDCSQHGICEIDTIGQAACICDPGYSPNGLDCEWAYVDDPTVGDIGGREECAQLFQYPFYSEHGMTDDFLGHIQTGRPGGIDYDGIIGDDVLSIGHGTVTEPPVNNIPLGSSAIYGCEGTGWGNHVIICFLDDQCVIYAHLKPGSIPLQLGDVVQPGQKIGEVGNTGNVCSSGGDGSHLHLGFKNDSGWIDPLTCFLDPIEFPEQGVTPLTCQDNDFDIYGQGNDCLLFDCDDTDNYKQSYGSSCTCLADEPGGEACEDRDGDNRYSGKNCPFFDQDCNDNDSSIAIGCDAPDCSTICTPGAVSCQGSKIITCSLDGYEWIPGDDCGSCGCSQGECDYDAQADYTCYNGDLWYLDCEGSRTSIKTSCECGCSGQSCLQGSDYLSCYNGDVWQYNCQDQRESLVDDCGSCGCSQGECDYDAQADYTCYNGDLWYLDCEGSRTSIKTSCECGCSGQSCLQGSDYLSCYNGDVWQYNCQDQRESLVDDCGSCGCSQGECDYDAQADYTCYNGDLWYLDCEGSRTSIKTSCECGCSGQSCIQGSDYLDCYNGDVWQYNCQDQRESLVEDCGSLGCTNGACNEPYSPSVVIVDNQDSSGFTKTGTWFHASDHDSFTTGAINQSFDYTINFLVDGTTGTWRTPTKLYGTYDIYKNDVSPNQSFNVNTEGTYIVYNKCTSVRYYVEHDGHTTGEAIDKSQAGSGWSKIGRFVFTDRYGEVRLQDYSATPDRCTISFDAIKWVKVN